MSVRMTPKQLASLTQAAPRGRRRVRKAAWQESEKDFQARIVALAHLHGWRVAAIRKVRVKRPNGSTYWETPMWADGVGWPDLVLVKGPRLLFWECKRVGAMPTPEQDDWLLALRLAGQQAQIVSPDDWPRIERMLSE
jgi:hypothetical protein